MSCSNADELTLSLSRGSCILTIPIIMFMFCIYYISSRTFRKLYKLISHYCIGSLYCIATSTEWVVLFP